MSLLFNPPVLEDGLGAYAYQPMLSTLYGYTGLPTRWIRIVDDGEGNFVTTQSKFLADSSEQTVSSHIETIELSVYFLYATYGFTPYIETMFSDYGNHGINMTKHKKLFMNQAALRSYEHRADSLLKICEDKKHALIGRSPSSNKVTAELVAELSGVLSLWEELMNTGNIRAAGSCLSLDGKEPRGLAIPLKKLKNKADELKTRMYYSNFVAMPYKMNEKQRDELLALYGCRR